MTESAAQKLPRWPFHLDAEKAIEAMLFVIPGIRHPTFHSIAKVLYQADRLHVDRYGRPISGDWYAAMRNGPVPSRMYDMMKALKGDEQVVLPEGAAQALAVEGEYNLRALRKARLDCLSASEQECLDESARTHGHKGFRQLTDESHDAAWNAADENDIIELEHFLLTLTNRDELIAHFANYNN